MKSYTLEPANRAAAEAAQTYVVAQTRSGNVRGSVTEGIHAFKGISFAAPPFGTNRLRAPRPVEPWTGVRDALNYGPKIPQPEYPPFVKGVIPPESCTTGQDCLNLNVWSPDLGSALLPVMVWIPGGVYAYHGTGASPWYDGSHFARDGVVCVTINYRVAADGFLYLGDADAGEDAEPGEYGGANRGLLDQIAALEWVRDNIAAFGGDPGNVTIFGESAGAQSVGTLLSMPRAEGLFRRAIAQSGAAHHVIPVGAARLVAQRLAEKLGVEPTRDAMREAIAGIPMERLLEAQTELEADLAMRPDPERWGEEVVAARMPWQPVVDGGLVPARPIDRIAAGASAGIDLLVGTNTEEHRLFLICTDMLDRVTDEAVAGAVAAYGLPVKETLSAYQEAYPGASPGDLMAAIQGDWFWRIPAIRMADAHANACAMNAAGPEASTAATYMYEFAWRSPQFGGRLGACHGTEMPFVFDTLGSGTEPQLGSNPPQGLADTMHAVWVEFASKGECPWPKYDINRRSTMHFDLTSSVVDDPLAMERALWAGVR